MADCAVAQPLPPQAAQSKSAILKGKPKMIRKFLLDESGIETLEYAVIGAIVAAVAVLIYGSGWGTYVKQTLVNAASTSTGSVTT
jgi:Flp pilus assembly pilin Flp